MKNLNIYVRNDLKMRKGKMAAQSAHAIMKLLFEVMVRSQHRMTLGKQQMFELNDFLANPIINIVMVKDENELNEILNKDLPYSIIVDSGRTEFHGVPTVTCAAQGIFSPCNISEIVVHHNYSSDIKAKQIFVYNKDIPLPKEMACVQSVLSCLTQLRDFLKIDLDGSAYYELSPKTRFYTWIMSAFAKIAVSVKTLDQLLELEQTLVSNNIVVNKVNKGGNYCLCVSPNYPDIIDPFTRSLALI